MNWNVPDSCHEEPYTGNGSYSPQLTCTYFNGERVCGEPGVRGTEGGWCPTHGIETETFALLLDSTEKRAEYRMDAAEREFAMDQIAKYQAARSVA